jgi:3-oxoacyl-[acyl-carrier protein] reductase
MELKGTVALVLGAIKGIGKGIALSLADAGVKAVLNYFDWEEELAVLEKDLDDIGQEHLILKTDLLETAAIPRMIQNVIDRFGCMAPMLKSSGIWKWRPPCAPNAGSLTPPCRI